MRVVSEVVGWVVVSWISSVVMAGLAIERWTSMERCVQQIIAAIEFVVKVAEEVVAPTRVAFTASHSEATQ